MENTLMRRKSIVAAAEKAFVNNTSGFFLRQEEELGATRRGDTGFSKGPRLLPDTDET